MVMLLSSEDLQFVQEDVARACGLPNDPVSFSNRYFPINPDPDRPGFGPDLPALSIEWLLFLLQGGSAGVVGPPGFTKTLILERFFLWLLSRNREIVAAYITRTDNKARDFVRVIKNRLEDPLFVADYGAWKDDEIWSSEKIRVVRKNDSKDPTLQGMGIVGQLESTRLKLAMIDDLSDFRSYHSKAERLYVKAWIDGTLLPRMDPGGIIVFIGSRWHVQDYISYLKIKKRFRGNVIEVKALQPDGSSLSEVIYPIVELMDLKESIGSTMFNLRMNGEAAEGGKQPFVTPRKCDLKYILEAGIYKRFAAIDFNASEKEQSDLTSISFISLLRSGEFVVDWVSSDHLLRRYETFIDDAVRRSRRYGFPDPEMTWAEATNFQYALGSYIDKELDVPIDITPLRAHDKDNRKDRLDLDYISKYNRIVAVLQGANESGKLMVYEDPANPRTGTSDIISDFELFPECPFYDPLDATQMCYRMARPYWRTRAPRKRRASAGY